MSEFIVSCPNCGTQLSASAEYIGRNVACPECGEHFVVSGSAYQAEFNNSNQTRSGNAQIGGDTEAIKFQCNPIMTFALIGASIVTTLILFCKAGSITPDARSCVECGANLKTLTFGGQWWRLATNAFLHFDVKHLVMNMLCLYSIGCLLERLIGHAKMIELYLLSAITGSLASCAVHPNDVCAGASGAVFGLFGAEIAYVMVLREKLGLTSKALGGRLKSGFVFIAINLIYSIMPGVDMATHVGGLLGGFAIGTVIASSVKKAKGGDVMTSRIVSGITILIALGLAVSIVTGKNAGRLSVPKLKEQVSQMLTDKLNEGNGEDGSFEVTNLHLRRGTGKRYFGDVEMEFKCGGRTYPLNSRIEVVHDAMETAFELNKGDFEEGLAELQKSLKQDSIDELTAAVSQMLTENTIKEIKKNGGKNVSVKVKHLSLTHDNENRYYGKVEIECRYDGETDMVKSRIDVTFDGETIAYELKDGD